MIRVLPIALLSVGCFDDCFSLNSDDKLVLFVQSQPDPVNVQEGVSEFQVVGQLPEIDEAEPRYVTRIVYEGAAVFEHVDCDSGDVIASNGGGDVEGSFLVEDLVECGGLACDVELCVNVDNRTGRAKDIFLAGVTEVSTPRECGEEDVTRLPPSFLYELELRR
ncbi:MAG: hypothetical protein AAGA48_27940 [Myxococcota bacterium]